MIPASQAIARAKPVPSVSGRGLLIETFGSPFSPLGEEELQVELIRALRARRCWSALQPWAQSAERCKPCMP